MVSVRRAGFEHTPPQPFSVPTPIVYEGGETQRWEYRCVSIDLREDEPLDEVALNALGADGWLLVSVTQPGGKGESATLIYYFMRPA